MSRPERVGLVPRSFSEGGPVPRRFSEGFTLIELMFALGIIATLAAMTIPISNSFIARAKADGASTMAVSAIKAARDRAIGERRNFQLHFDLPPLSRIRVVRVEVPAPDMTEIARTELENGQSFKTLSGVPDTPDQFGTGTAAVRFTGTAPVMFTSDGSLIDSNGDVVNGTVFLAQGDDKGSARAITILGVTGLIRTWKWSGTQWQE